MWYGQRSWKITSVYVEHLKQEWLKNQQKVIEKQEQVEKKRKLGEMLTEEKKLQKKLKVLKDEEKAAQKPMERPMGYVHQGCKKISGGMKTNDMVKAEAGHKFLEFGQDMLNEAKKKVVQH